MSTKTNIKKRKTIKAEKLLRPNQKKKRNWKAGYPTTSKNLILYRYIVYNVALEQISYHVRYSFEDHKLALKIKLIFIELINRVYTRAVYIM